MGITVSQKDNPEALEAKLKAAAMRADAKEYAQKIIEADSEFQRLMAKFPTELGSSTTYTIYVPQHLKLAKHYMVEARARSKKLAVQYDVAADRLQNAEAIRSFTEFEAVERDIERCEKLIGDHLSYVRAREADYDHNQE
jgi:hypothetical protein